MNRVIQKDVFIPIRKEFVLRRLGYGKYRPGPDEIDRRVREYIKETRALIEPKMVYVDTEIIGKK